MTFDLLQGHVIQYGKTLKRLKKAKTDGYLCRLTDGIRRERVKGGIGRSGHFAITYGGELFFCQIFSLLSLLSNFFNVCCLSRVD